ncbi:lysozyme inhibitor LprI family protein [Paraburkholderia sp.]|uniref:lysozyme inhibitor LprI family protein n=1 Tax=Paraburkholderia sp. TaxID=1926495 RepID=UPI003D6EF52E
MKKRLSLILLLATASTQAWSTEPLPATPYSKAYAACTKKSGSPGFYDQSAAARCDEAEVKLQKTRINTAYNKILKMWANDPLAIEKLNKAQKAWVQWRDGTYHLLQENGGSNGQVVYIVSSSFLLKSLADQANLLEGILAANGGN